MVQFLNTINKIPDMKKLLITLFSFSLFVIMDAQASRTDMLRGLEENQTAVQELKLTATIRTATRLFREKDDLTTVIMIIPKESVVDVIGSDSTYFHVLFEGNDGYIYRRHAQLGEPVDASKPVIQKAEPVVQEPKPEAQPEQQQSRFSYLEDKYGTSMAAKLIAGKIWKGMNAEMVRDSWGKAQKINRVISGNIVKEEWIYKNTWLYLENDKLVEWGPIKD
jgi:hypothetical protein